MTGALVQAAKLEPRVLLSAMPIGPEFQVNTFTTGAQGTNTETGRRLAMDAAGNFVVVWSSNGQDGSGAGIYAQRYDADGVALGGEFQVNTYTTNNQLRASVAMDADGDFVVTWESFGQDGDFYGVYAQRFDAAAVAQGTEFQVNDYTTGFQYQSQVAMDDAGNFVVTWTSGEFDVNGFTDVLARRYDADGTALGGAFRVNTYTTNTQWYSTVAMDADGDFVIAWQTERAPGPYGVYAQRYTSAGTAVGSEFGVSSGRPKVAMSSSGDFVIVTEALGNVVVRPYSANGTPQGAAIPVETFSLGSDFDADVAINDDGSFV
ncbi:MAG: hypothetical protein SH850_29385, partial [Planctomycetaceae bacterium]|nr:hypothetical protein [Planctomycetaceae bacterium]